LSTAPRVTVVIPVYNREAYVATALDSVLAQSFADFELLVVDDGSTDNSRAIVGAHDDQRIRLVSNDRNRGIAATRNRAVGLARGDYLAFLDSDDIACPDRLARQVDFLDGHPDVAAVGGWVAWMDGDGRRLGTVKRVPTAPDDIAAGRLFRPGVINTTAMARSAVLRDFPHREDLAVGSDFDMWARFASVHKVANLPAVVGMFRDHDSRATGEFASQVATVRHGIYAAQLTALGIAFTEKDLERHFMLRRMHKVGFTPDVDYLDWSEAWLLGLQTANRVTGLYPEPAFSHELGVFWAKACRHAPAPVRFLASPLKRCAWPGLWKLARRHAAMAT